MVVSSDFLFTFSLLSTIPFSKQKRLSNSLGYFSDTNKLQLISASVIELTPSIFCKIFLVHGYHRTNHNRNPGYCFCACVAQSSATRTHGFQHTFLDDGNMGAHFSTSSGYGSP
ncbi:MAG: hypothetical protein IPL84_03725 [Chitinophagaceae bacterium]|nr:hypothetical protein [Chitinophagaceae bacterium]